MQTIFLSEKEKINGYWQNRNVWLNQTKTGFICSKVDRFRILRIDSDREYR